MVDAGGEASLNPVLRRDFLTLRSLTTKITTLLCRSGEIGRRSGLKIHRGQLRAGSIPASGTIHFTGFTRLNHKLKCLTLFWSVPIIVPTQVDL
jgi:hypothetical protein